MLRVCSVYSLEIIFRRRGEPEFCADEILEDCAIIATDRPVRFVADDQLKIRRRKLGEESVAGGKALDCGHDHLRLFPFLAFLFVDHGLDSVVREVSLKIPPSLSFQLQSIDEKQDASRVFSAEIKLRDRGAQQRLARAGRHFKKEPVLAARRGALQRTDRVELIIAQQPNFLVDHERFAIGGGIGQPGGVLRNGDVVLIDCGRCEPCGIRTPFGSFAQFFKRQESRNLYRVSLPQIPIPMNQPVA